MNSPPLPGVFVYSFCNFHKHSLRTGPKLVMGDCVAAYHLLGGLSWPKACREPEFQVVAIQIKRGKADSGLVAPGGT